MGEQYAGNPGGLPWVCVGVGGWVGGGGGGGRQRWRRRAGEPGVALVPAQCRLTRSEEAAPPSAAPCWTAAGFAALRCIARMRCTVYLQGGGGGFADVFTAVRHRPPLGGCVAALDGPRVQASFVTSCRFLARHRLGTGASEPGQKDQGGALLARPPAAGSCPSTQAPAPHPSKACLAPWGEAAALGD